MSDPPAEQAVISSICRSGWQRVQFCLGVARHAVASAIWVLVACGVGLRLTIQDRVYPWSLVYYMTPIPAMSVWMVIAAVVSGGLVCWRCSARSTRRWFRWSQSRLSLLAAIVFAGWTAYAEYDFRPRPTRPDDRRVVFWNVARVWMGIDRIGARLRDLDAVVIGLVEADEQYRIHLDQWQQQLPGYEVAQTVFGSLIAVKGTVVSHQVHDLSIHSYCEEFHLRVDGDEFSVLLVDIASDLHRSRRRPLQALAGLAERLSDRPVIIMGDFNTPDDSVWFEPLRKQHQQAFRHRGSGYAATWPVPLPVLTIDQMWTNGKVRVSRCQNEWTSLSDHRPIVCHLSIEP
jgi:vancomycin resistance protein VanJ